MRDFHEADRRTNLARLNREFHTLTAPTVDTITGAALACVAIALALAAIFAPLGG